MPNLSGAQKAICIKIINVFETGSVAGDYSNISIFNDGPHRIRQITYGRSQTTEYSHLAELVAQYVNAGGLQAEDLRPFLKDIGVHSLVDNAAFLNLLRTAGHDPIMRKTQDDLFDKAYWVPAMQWADAEKLTLPLSALVVYDSFIHSGSILKSIRARFAEVPPVNGGDEKAWTAAYVNARNDWLANHPHVELHNTVYRTQCFKREIARHNWDLSQLPIQAHGVAVS